MRCFIGIKINGECLSKIKKLAQNLACANVEGNFVASTNVHITLAFLGEICDEKIKIVEKILEKIDFKEFFIRITALKKMKDMLILEVEKTDQLLKIRNEIVNGLKEKQIPFDEKEFYPHITLVRKANLFFEKQIEYTNLVSKISLFNSKNISGKLVYEEIYTKEQSLKEQSLKEQLIEE